MIINFRFHKISYTETTQFDLQIATKTTKRKQDSRLFKRGNMNIYK